MPSWPLSCESESILSEKFLPHLPQWAGVFIWEIFIPVTDTSVAKKPGQPGFLYAHIDIFFTKERVARRDLGNRATTSYEPG